MKITVITLFPEIFRGWQNFGPLKAAQDAGSLSLCFLNPKHYSKTPKDTDDYPFGGGPGMVLRPEPILRAVADATRDKKGLVLLASARGRPLTQKWVRELIRQEHLVLICGRYKDVDQRVAERADGEFSVGDFVLSGGEGAVLCLVDAAARLLPGALGHEDSAVSDSFEDGLLGPPSYTRPREYLGARVPEVLLSGDHARVARWRKRASLLYTLCRRPDLVARRTTDVEMLDLLKESVKELSRGRSDKGR